MATWIGAGGGNIVDAGETRDAEHGLFIQRVEFTHDDDLDACVVLRPARRAPDHDLAITTVRR